MQDSAFLEHFMSNVLISCPNYRHSEHRESIAKWEGQTIIKHDISPPLETADPLTSSDEMGQAADERRIPNSLVSGVKP